MMNRWKDILLLTTLLALSQAAPVLDKAVNEPEDEGEIESTGLEYDNYLRMVVKTLENDPEMKKKLDDLSLDDLKTGKMSEIMDGVSDKIRARLDDLKRTEIQRLRQVARQRFQQANHRSMDQKSIDDMVGHIDINSMDQFGGKDFEKLIKKATEDLDKADSARKQEFKRYEMQKEIERRQKLQMLDEEKRKAAEKEYQEKHNKKKEKHLKHPGSKPQLEEVWEETDHLEKDDFNPKTFFQLHDTNNDGNLDVFELEALFVKQVRTYYESINDGNPDPNEVREEMARMREHVLGEIDTDKDHMVSKKEFLAAADSDDFGEDKGWEDLDEKDIYTEEELDSYEKKIEDEMRNLKLKMQKEHEAFQQEKKEGGGPVKMSQGGMLNAEQLAEQALQNAADKEAENFHQAHDQIQNTINQAAVLVEQAKKEQEQQAQAAAVRQAQIKAQEEIKQHQQVQQQQQGQQQQAQQQAQLKAQQEAQLKAQQEAQLKAQQEAQLKAQQEAQLKAQREAQLRAQQQQQAQQQQAQQQQAQQQQAQQQQAQQQQAQQQQAQQQQAQQQQAQQAQQQQAQQQQAQQQQAQQQQAQQQQAQQQQAQQQQAQQQQAQQQQAQQQQAQQQQQGQGGAPAPADGGQSPPGAQ